MKTYQRGNSGVVELVVICAILLIAFMVVNQRSNTAADGTVCRGGYKFIQGARDYTQVLDTEGRGIPCDAK